MKPKHYVVVPDDPFYDIEKVSSATECTGLIPRGPESEEEAEAYSELYAIHSPDGDAGK